MYAMDVRKMYDEQVAQKPEVPIAIARKTPLANPALTVKASWTSAGIAFRNNLQKATFKGIVCDFDGTCCNTSMRYDGLDLRLVKQIERLLSCGIRFAFASGRGESLQTDLRAKLSKELWRDVTIGNYSGSLIACLESKFVPPQEDPRLAALRDWLVDHCMTDNVNQIKIRGGQLGLSANSFEKRTFLVSAIRYWIALNRHVDWRVFCSGHSVDVLTKEVSKSNVVSALAKQTSSDISSELLRIGDSGQFDGNDFELLSDGLGLSVANVSPIRSSCWNLLPKGICGAAGTGYYLESLEAKSGQAFFSKSFISQVTSRLVVDSEMYR